MTYRSMSASGAADIGAERDRLAEAVRVLSPGVQHMGVQSGIDQCSLPDAIRRLHQIAITAEGANGRSSRFLDALIGPSPQGASTGASSSQEAVGLFAVLHDLLDRVERAVDVAFDRSGALLLMVEDPSLQNASAAPLHSGTFNSTRIA